MFNKLENWVFYIFIFSIPISLRHIFWFEPFNFIEWTSVYIYATDILLFVLLGFWIKSKSFQFPVSSLQKADYFLLAFVVVAGFSIWGALDVQTAVFQWLKLIEGVALYFYVKNYALKRFELRHILEIIIISATFQSIIAIAQFMKQGSLGLKYLGESPLAPAFSGIAAFLVDGAKIIRVYGTTPHSNVLALYLFIALGTFYSIAIYQKRGWLWHVCHGVILWAFFLTFSRVIIGLWLINFLIRSLLVRFYKPFHKEFWEDSEMRRRSLKIFLMTIIVGALFVSCYWSYVANRSIISSGDEAIQLRILYNQESLAGGVNWFGLGLGNFVPWLMTQDLHLSREIYQPVHNIYLLIYSETGIVGVALFLLFLAFLLYDFYHRLFAGRRIKKLYHFSFALIIVSILIFGLFDHYLWTIQSGRLLFFLALGLLAGAE
ncbi:MAG: hypothetical protein Q8P69_01660 [bacterium]|nr:hypothetical protein [bacterium]